MSFFKNLKEKLVERLEKPIYSDVKRIPADDVALLAIMCRKCAPIVIRKHILVHILDLYAYYVPQNESDIDMAKSLFAKHGINMDTHFSHIVDNGGQAVLRINYAFCNDKNLLVKNMANIREKYITLYSDSHKEEKEKLWQKIAELKQNQK